MFPSAIAREIMPGSALTCAVHRLLLLFVLFARALSNLFSFSLFFLCGSVGTAGARASSLINPIYMMMFRTPRSAAALAHGSTSSLARLNDGPTTSCHPDSSGAFFFFLSFSLFFCAFWGFQFYRHLLGCLLCIR